MLIVIKQNFGSKYNSFLFTSENICRDKAVDVSVGEKYVRRGAALYGAAMVQSVQSLHNDPNGNHKINK